MFEYIIQFFLLIIIVIYKLIFYIKSKKETIISELDNHNYHKKNINNNLTYIGKSIAAQGTSFYLKELGILIDAGQNLGSNTTNIKLILITHKDADHIKCICSHILNSNFKPIIICPNSLSDQLANMITTFFNAVNNSIHDNCSNHCNIIGMISNQTYIFNKSIEIKTFKSYHGHTQCLSYGLSHISKGLKEKYIGLKSRDYIKLKKDGIVITQERKKPFLFFATDTTIDLFKNIEIFKYTTIMCECTLLYKEHKLGTRKHIHWNDLQNIIKKYSDTNFILFHFSEQYKEIDVYKFFHELTIKNVKPYFI